MGILICGLNGSGKSTVGKALARRIGYRLIDVEDLYFPKDDTNYKYGKPRGKEEVISILNAMIEENSQFVFAAVKGDYGEKLIEAIDLAIVIDVPKEIRLKRVYDRSYEKYKDRILPGGDLYEKENAFFSAVESRPDNFVTEWLEKTANCPVINIDGTLPVEKNVNYLVEALEKN